jgi:putative ABC transport system permease protein
VVVRTAPEAGPQVAATIDRMFQSSLAETRTESERAFNLSFIAMSAAIVKAVQVVSFVVLAIILLVLGNTIAMGTRERTSELAVMRAIGFRPRHVIGLVIGEGVVVAALGAALGLALARPVLRFIADAIETALGAFLGPFELSWRAAALAVAVCVAGGVLAAAIPAWRAGRLVIVDALRRTE